MEKENGEYILKIRFSTAKEAMDAKHIIENADEMYSILYELYEEIDITNTVGIEARIVDLVNKIEGSIN